MLLDQFDLVKVINLAQRADRRREIRQQFENLGVGSDCYELFEACAPPDAGMFLSRGANGCFQSHFAILQMAADAGKSVLIVEDDCDFAPEAQTYEVPPGTDIFYGGYEAMDDGELIESRIIGSHLMGFSAKGAKVAVAYLTGFGEPGFAVDPVAAAHPDYNPAIRPGIDGAYVWLRRAHPELKVHFAQPPIGFQRRSRSDVAPLRFYDRLPGLRLAASIARAVCR
jgi:glycosyl transferase family 25